MIRPRLEMKAATRGPYRYRVAGVGIRSNHPLFGLEPYRGHLKGDWRLSLIKPGASFPDPRSYRRFRIRRGPERSLVMIWPKEAAFRIRPGKSLIEYFLAPGLSREVFLDILLGPVVSYLLLFEKSDPFHASAVRVGNAAACFLGPSGAGKSTLAAAFLRMGYGVVVDDVLAIEWPGNRPHVVPGYPEIRLWPGSGKKLYRDFDRLPRVVPASSKRRLDPRVFGGGFSRKAVPVKVFYELRRSNTDSTPRVRSLEGMDAFLALLKNLYNPSALTADTPRRRFHAIRKILKRIPVKRLILPRAAGDPLKVPAFVLRDLMKMESAWSPSPTSK